MTKATLASAVTAALLASGLWAGLRGGECRDVVVACDWTEDAKGNTLETPHVETVTISGDKQPAEVALDQKPACHVLKYSEPYACSALAADVARYAEDKQPASGCACSTGANCERLRDGKWVAAPKKNEAIDPGQWRGAGCVPLETCVEPASMSSGVGAVQPLGWPIPPECSGPGKRLHPVLEAVKAEVAAEAKEPEEKP